MTLNVMQIMAKKIADGLLRGNAREYQLTDKNYVIVSRANTWNHGDEVMVFPSDGNGNVTDWKEEMYCARAKWGDDMSDEAALASLNH